MTTGYWSLPTTETTILVVDDDPVVADGLSSMLKRDGRTVVVCHDLQSAQLALDEFPFTHVVSDLELSSAALEGVQLVDSARRTHPDSRIVVVSGSTSTVAMSTALAVGADFFLSKPCESSEIEAALGAPVAHPIGSAFPEGGVLHHVHDLDAILASHDLTSHYQPIFDLTAGALRPVAFEALARPGYRWPFRDMSTLFEYAVQKKRAVELNTACIDTAFSNASRLPADTLLFVNLDPRVLGSRDFVSVIRRAATASGIDLSRVIFELTEHAMLFDQTLAFKAIDALRWEGARFAIDDAESAAANLRFLEQIRPEYFKLSHRLGSSFQKEPRKLNSVTRIAALARVLGARVVLEGIDSRETLDAAREAGIDYVQGFWLGPPAEAQRFTIAEVQDPLA